MNGIDELRALLMEHKEAFRAVITAPRDGSSQVKRLDARPVTIKGESMVQLTRRVGNQNHHQNLAPDEAVEAVLEALPDFRQGVFDVPGRRMHALTNRRGEVSLRMGDGSRETAPATHDKKRERVLENPGWMRALGLVSAAGTTMPGMGDKQRQIDHFLRLLLEAVSDIKEPYELIDLCCGKGYLTFAAASALPHVRVTGMDLKGDVIERLNAVARAEGMTNLSFLCGDVRDCPAPALKPFVVSLHACDTATDVVLAQAVGWGAPAVLCAPCCQHELYAQVENPLLRPLLKHNLIKERYAALLTDALRASLLETRGYRVDAVEFTDPDHTPKNLMLRAVYTGRRAQAREYEALRDAMGVRPSLEGLLSDSRNNEGD